MFVGRRHGAVLHSFKTCRTLVPAAARQPPHRTWIELSATIDFMLARQRLPPLRWSGKGEALTASCSIPVFSPTDRNASARPERFASEIAFKPEFNFVNQQPSILQRADVQFCHEFSIQKKC
jgi:hypothetical protein